jgi:hypothetical protein
VLDLRQAEVLVALPEDLAGVGIAEVHPVDQEALHDLL